MIVEFSSRIDAKKDVPLSVKGFAKKTIINRNKISEERKVQSRFNSVMDELALRPGTK